MIKRIIISVLVLAFGVWFWRTWLGRTDIAFVNYQAIQMGEIARANDNAFIRVAEVGVDELDELEDYDFVFVNAMGLHITEAQRAQLQAIADGGMPILTTAITNPANDINTLDDYEADTLKRYLAASGRSNYRSMLNYVRRFIDGKLVSSPEPEPVVESGDYLIYHSDVDNPSGEDLGFNSVAEYQGYLKSKGLWREGGEAVVVTGMMGDYHYIVSELERQGYVGYYVTAFRQFVVEHHVDSVKPVAIVNMAHGRMGDYAVDYLSKANIPLFAPLNVNRLASEWEADKQGMSGGFLSQSVVTPEIDGALRPYVLFAHYVNSEDLQEVRAVPCRLEEFISTVNRHVALRHKPNKDKRIGIVYFKGPGQSSLVASGMEVVPSLYNLLVRLRQEGYDVSGLPSSAAELGSFIQERGSVFGTYAEGAAASFMSKGSPVMVTREEFDTWAAASLSDTQRRELSQSNGAFPGIYMSDGEGRLALPCLRFGNVVLMPQMPAGTGSDSFSMVHGTNDAPPYPYVAEYLYLLRGLEVDAIVHFGTHGSLEYTPRKQMALGDDDWSARLIGDRPHLYVYTIGNVGESLIAKRRSFAEVVSYLTAPFLETELRSTYKQLADAIETYQTLPENASDQQRIKAAETVKKMTHVMGIDSELQIGEGKEYQYTADDILRVENYAEELANEKMTGSLYVLGQPYSDKDIESTVVAMCADPIAYSLLKLDKLRGCAAADEEKRQTAFTRKYLQPAKRLVADLLRNGAADPDALLCRVAGVSQADIDKARQIVKSQSETQDMMSMMMMAAQSSKKGAGMAVMMGGHKRDTTSRGGSALSASMRAKMRSMARGMDPQKALDMAKKMGASPEALKKMEQKMKESAERRAGGSSGGGMMGGGHGMPSPQYSEAAKDSAQAILEVAQALANVANYREALKTSPENELVSIVNALNGGYVAPQPGGDPVSSPNALPTGRNLFGINAEATPSEAAWKKGVELAEQTIDMYRRQHGGDYPRKVSYTLWSGEFIETQGATVAQVLYMLGIEPVRDFFGRVNDLRLIPAGKLGRPRIDVTVQTSGQLRDLAASRLFLINRAVSMAAEANDSGAVANNVADGLVAAEKYLTDKGVSPKEAREVARHRVFGALNGGYGTGIQSMVMKSDSWDETGSIAEVYLNNMNAYYGSATDWETVNQYAFEAALTNTDAVVQPRQSNTCGALSLDHVYEFSGGLSLAVEKVTGKSPDAYLSDYRNRNHVKMQGVREAIGIEGRATLFNPAFIKEKMKGGASSANELAEMVSNTFGWNVTKPDVVDKRAWERIYDVYVKDSLGLGTKDFFENNNPAAL